MKSLFKKIFIFFIAIFIVQLLVTSSQTNATFIEMPTATYENELSLKDCENEKIMKINAKTGKKTEVNINYNEIAPILEKMEKTHNYSTELVAPTKSFLNSSLNTFFPKYSKSASQPYTACLNSHEVSTQMPICKIVVGGNDYGTGFLIGEKYLLTAAHCVLTEDTDVEVLGYWSAFAGYCNGRYVQEMGWSNVYFSSNWPMHGGASNFDWAIVELDGNYGNSVGWLVCTKYYDYNDLMNENVSAWGYPGNYYNGQYLCYSKGNVYYSDAWAINSSCIVEGGFSGGPTRLSDMSACGINVGKWDNSTLKSIRFNDTLYNLILDLLNG